MIHPPLWEMGVSAVARPHCVGAEEVATQDGLDDPCFFQMHPEHLLCCVVLDLADRSSSK